MNLSETKTNAPERPINYTDEIINRLEDLSVKLNNSTGQIAESLEKLIGQDDLSTRQEKESKPVRDAAYGQIHDIIDDIFITARINDENSEKLKRVI